MKQNTRTTRKTTAKTTSQKVTGTNTENKKAAAKEVTEVQTKAAAPAETVKVSEPVKPEPAKTESVKVTPAKKSAETKLVVEYHGKQVEEKDMIASVKAAWTKSGKKESDIQTMTLYVKPEENAIYYVINETETGKADF